MHDAQPQMMHHSAVELVVSVVDVQQGERVLHVYRDSHALVDFVCMAHGTARTEMLDLLGIGETAKIIVMCLMCREEARALLARLGRELEMRYPGRGIAFSVPITGIGVRWHKLLTQSAAEEEVHCMNKQEKAGFPS